MPLVAAGGRRYRPPPSPRAALFDGLADQGGLVPAAFDPRLQPEWHEFRREALTAPFRFYKGGPAFRVVSPGLP